MMITVEEEHKIRIARWGAVKLFGNPDERQKMTEEELTKRFDEIWEKILQRAVTSADSCDSQAAFEKVTDKEKSYFDFCQEHRQFRLKDQNIEFIAQLKATSDDRLGLTQLWKVSSTDKNPKTLYVTFDTVQEREQFEKLANQLGWHDEQLGLQLVLDFIKKLSIRP